MQYYTNPEDKWMGLIFCFFLFLQIFCWLFSIKRRWHITSSNVQRQLVLLDHGILLIFLPGSHAAFWPSLSFCTEHWCLGLSLWCTTQGQLMLRTFPSSFLYQTFTFTIHFHRLLFPARQLDNLWLIGSNTSGSVRYPMFYTSQET